MSKTLSYIELCALNQKHFKKKLKSKHLLSQITLDLWTVCTGLRPAYLVDLLFLNTTELESFLLDLKSLNDETTRYITIIIINSDSVFFVDTRKLYSYLNSLNYSNDIYVVNLSDSKALSLSIDIPPSLSESISTLQSKLHNHTNSHSTDSSTPQLISLTIDPNSVIPLTGVILTYPFVYYLDVSGGSSCLSTVDLIVTRVIYCIEDAKFNGSAREHVIISFSVPYLIMQEERLKQGGMRDRKRLESVEGVGRVKGVKVVYKSDRVDESVWSIPPLQKFWERLETVMVDESVKKNWSLEKLVLTVDVVNQGRIVL